MLYKIPVQEEMTITSVRRGIADPEFLIIGILKFKFTSRFAILLFFTVIFIVLVEAWIIIAQLRTFLRTAVEGEPFEPMNIKRIRVIGWTLLTATVLKVLLAAIFVFYLKNPVMVSGSSAPLYWRSISDLFESQLTVIVLGLLVLVIAEIFRIGSALKEDQELTI